LDVLLSIRPEYADAILDGTKRYEFRRVAFSRPDVTRIYLYATSKVRRIVGWFEVDGVYRDSPERIWERCRDHAGISADDFFRYFEGCSRACAIRVRNPVRFPEPVDPHVAMPGFAPPQSFRYLPSNWLAGCGQLQLRVVNS